MFCIRLGNLANIHVHGINLLLYPNNAQCFTISSYVNMYKSMYIMYMYINVNK